MSTMKYKVRFAHQRNFILGELSTTTSFQDDGFQAPLHNRRPIYSKSRQGCRECKRRRVKCDETFPVCLRCQRRGSVCVAEPKPILWQTELPSLTISSAPSLTSSLGSHVNIRLLQKWLERTSQIMVLDPENNPLSYPILQLLASSPWLASVLQSISAGHEYSFEQSGGCSSLIERSRALSALVTGITSPKQPLAALLIGIFLLGVSTCWIEGDPTTYGKDHLFGARAVLQLILEDSHTAQNEIEQFAIGTFLYWDMSCSLLVDPAEQIPLDRPEIITAVSLMRSSFHPISGIATELFYLLGLLGRYCRRVLGSGSRDLVFEETIEEQILAWDSPHDSHELTTLGEAFRTHGLILLYSICKRRHDDGAMADSYGNSLDFSPTSDEDSFGSSYEVLGNESLMDEISTQALVRTYALDTVASLKATPIGSSHFSMQPIPLLTAGSELWEEDVAERQEVLDRFNALYSMNRTPVNRWAIQLLEEVWENRRLGFPVTWIELMLQKGWRICLG